VYFSSINLNFNLSHGGKELRGFPIRTCGLRDVQTHESRNALAFATSPDLENTQSQQIATFVCALVFEYQ
jgi:hypothetical protein